jgi:hypothetical protein
MNVIEKVFKALESMAHYPDRDGGDPERLRGMAKDLRKAATYADALAAAMAAANEGGTVMDFAEQPTTEPARGARPATAPSSALHTPETP